MRVNIVCYEDTGLWIIGKFATKLNEELNKKGISSTISKKSSLDADINHHLIFADYDLKKSTIDTLMITHVDTLFKLDLLRKQLKLADMGICMSKSTLSELVNADLPSDRLCYINPAQDGIIKPRQIVVGIMFKVMPEGRKQEEMLVELCERIDSSEFMFKIMGGGWKDTIEKIKQRGFKVEYYEEFDYEIYNNLIPTLDYYLYFGKDEGSIGLLDALAAGVPTISTMQGFHCDIENGVTYPISDSKDIIRVFSDISKKRRRLVNSVSTWTWENYALKHIKVWKYLLERKQSRETTGDNPFKLENDNLKASIFKKVIFKLKLFQSTLRYYWCSHKNKQFTIRGALRRRIKRLGNNGKFNI